MAAKKAFKQDIHAPEVVAATLERLRTMPIEELDAMLTHRKEGVEVTNMNEELAQWYRRQEAKKREAEQAAIISTQDNQSAKA